MLTDAQVFGNNFTAAAAHLRSVLEVNQCHTSTSAYRLVHGELHKLISARIRYITVMTGDDNEVE